MDREIYVPPQGPPQQGPSREIYGIMGEKNIFRMLEDFYLELEKSTIRGLFPGDMKEASHKSAKFFVGLLGGPPLYAQEYGPPRMRARHMPFAIDKAAQEVWLACFEKVLAHAEDNYGFPSEHLEGFKVFLKEFSGWMVNKR